MRDDCKSFFTCAFRYQFCCSSGVHKARLISTLCMCMGCIIVVCISMAAMAKSFYLEFWLLHFEIVVLKLYAIHTSAIKGTVEQDEK